MSHWCWGLVEEKNGIILAEIYFNDEGEFMSYCPVLKKEFRSKKDRIVMSQDIRDAILEKMIFKGEKK